MCETNCRNLVDAFDEANYEHILEILGYIKHLLRGIGWSPFSEFRDSEKKNIVD